MTKKRIKCRVNLFIDYWDTSRYTLENRRRRKKSKKQKWSKIMAWNDYDWNVYDDFWLKVNRYPDIFPTTILFRPGGITRGGGWWGWRPVDWNEWTGNEQDGVSIKQWRLREINFRDWEKNQFSRNIMKTTIFKKYRGGAIKATFFVIYIKF